MRILNPKADSFELKTEIELNWLRINFQAIFNKTENFFRISSDTDFGMTWNNSNWFEVNSYPKLSPEVYLN